MPDTPLPRSSADTTQELLAATPHEPPEKQQGNSTIDNMSESVELAADVLDCISDVSETVVSTAGEVLSAVGQGLGSILEGLS